jgi:hypothetical protein
MYYPVPKMLTSPTGTKNYSIPFLLLLVSSTLS